MKSYTKIVHECGYCKKKYFIKTPCIKHENICYKNPLNERDCFLCDSLTKKAWGGYNLLFCKQKNMFVYPPLVEKKQNAINTEGDDYCDDMNNNPMPKKCSLFRVKEY